MAKAVLELIAKTEGWTGGIKRAQTGLTNFIKTHGGLHQALAQDNQTMAQAIRKFSEFESKNATVAGRLRETEAAFMELGMAYKQMTAQERATPAGQATLEYINKTIPKIREMRGQMKDLQGQLSLGGGAGAGFGKQFVSSLVPGFGMGAGAAAAMMAVKALNTLKDVTIDTIKTNMSFEQSNANLAAILGKTTGEIYELTENAKQLGGTTLFTASQIAELQTVLSRRGFTQGQILDMTHGISNLAIATGTDLAESAELAASTMQAFGMRATDMERIVSVLGVSTTKSALTTQALATSLQYVAPTARAAGFSLEDTVAMLGVLVDSGLEASTAGTSLRQIILGMSTANGKLANSFGHPIRGLKDFTESLKKMKEDGNASLDEISKKVRVTAVPAFLSLVENADRLDTLRDSITGVNDELQEMADKQMNTAQGASIMLQSAWEGLKLTFDESNGPMRDTLLFLTEIVNRVKELRQLNNGGQGAVNVQLGPEEEFKRKTAERAKNWVQDWENSQKSAILRGGGASGVLPATGFGIDGFGVTWESNVSEYATAQEEAAAKLKEQKELYDQLIPLSETYAKHRDEVVSKGQGGAFVAYTDSYNQAVRAKIKELLGRDMSYEQLDAELKKMYESIKMYEAVVQGSGTDDFSGVLLEDEVTGDGTTGTVTIVERAKDIIAKALLRYEQELKELQNRLRAGLIDQAEFDRRKVGLDENVWEAYGRADMLEPSQEWKDGMAKWGKQMKEDADIAANSGAMKKMVQAEERYARTFDLAAMKEEQGLQDSIASNKQRLGAEESLYNVYSALYAETKDPKYLEEMTLLAEAIRSWREIIKEQEDELKRQREKQSIYNRALRSIESTARGNNIRYADIGVKGFKELINNNQMTDSMMEDAVKKLNEQLKTKGIRWTVQLDLETGTLEKLKSRLDEVFEGIGKGTGGVKSIVSALDSIKNAGENMKETLQGDADGWDKMIAVMNMAISPFEAMVTIYEAINALKEMSMILSAKETAEKVAEVASNVTGTQAEVAAESEKIATDKLATKASMELATSNFMAAHASIPFVGFAIGSGFSAGALAMTKANGLAALAFHNGGKVPGAYNGGRDTVHALLSPGEIILNRAQQNTLAPQLQAPKWGMDGGNIHFEIQGRKLIGVINNEIAAQGGGRSVRIFSH